MDRWKKNIAPRRAALGRAFWVSTEFYRRKDLNTTQEKGLRRRTSGIVNTKQLLWRTPVVNEGKKTQRKHETSMFIEVVVSRHFSVRHWLNSKRWWKFDAECWDQKLFWWWQHLQINHRVWLNDTRCYQRKGPQMFVSGHVCYGSSFSHARSMGQTDTCNMRSFWGA